MSAGSFTTTLELSINGNPCEREATVRYEYSPAGGDGWHEPRYAEGASLYSVECEHDVHTTSGLVIKTIDLLPLLTKECINALEADCCQREADEREYRKSEAAEAKRDAAWEAV